MMKKLGLIFLFALLTIQIAQAQEATPSPDGALFTFTFETHAFDVFFPLTEWLPDSQSFVIHTIQNGVLENAPLLQYFVAANKLRSLAFPIGQIQLSEVQRQALAASSYFAFTSPNGHYAIYSTEEQVCGEGGCSNVPALVDLETGAHSTFHTPIPLGNPDRQGNFIRWSADSSALLITDSIPSTVWYVDVADALAKSEDFQPRLLMNFTIGEVVFLDISRDGKRVLIRNATGGGVFLWDARLPNSGAQFAAAEDGQLMLINNPLSGASFIPGDDQHLFVVVREGLARYDLKTDQIEVLNPAINSQWVTWAYFSPNVRYLLTYAQLENGSDWQGQIALYPVEGSS